MSQPFYVRRLSKSERRSIARLRKKPPYVGVYRRATAVHFSAQRLEVSQIARIVDRDRSVVSRWLHRFERDGLSGLWPGKSPGRPPKADTDFQAALAQAVAQNPRELGYSFTRWTLPLLAEHMRRLTHVQVSTHTVSRALRRMKFHYGRPKLDLKHRQDPKEVARAKGQKKCALKKREQIDVLWRFSTLTKRNSTSIPVSAPVGMPVVGE